MIVVKYRRGVFEEKEVAWWQIRIRLAEEGAPLKEHKHLQLRHYSDEKVRAAV